MNTVLVAGYPKSGNTLLGGALRVAGRCESDFDIYSLRANNQRPAKNNLFQGDTYVIKTHDRWKPQDDLSVRYFAPVEKVVVVVRNPFDTVLSSINFLRVQYASGNLKAYILTLNMLFPGVQVGDDFLDFFSLDNLKKCNLLDSALENFSLYGACIPSFSRMSGPWAGFAKSYKYSGLKVLNLKYEDLALLSQESQVALSDGSQNTLSTLSGFLNVSQLTLLEGFKSHRKRALMQKKAGNLFFNKMKSGYWKDYFSQEACKHFVNQFAAEMIDNGYSELVDQFYH